MSHWKCWAGWPRNEMSGTRPAVRILRNYAGSPGQWVRNRAYSLMFLLYLILCLISIKETFCPLLYHALLVCEHCWGGKHSVDEPKSWRCQIRVQTWIPCWSGFYSRMHCRIFYSPPVQRFDSRIWSQQVKYVIVRNNVHGSSSPVC